MRQLEDRTTNEQKYYSLNRKVWDILAPFYDFIVLPISRLRDSVVTFTNANQGSTILDVATGTGKQAFAFAKRGFDVVGIDLSEAMLKVATKKNKYAKAKFQVADATNLPFMNNSFDVTCVSFALHEMPSTIMHEVLKETVRVTKQRGMIVIVDYGLPKNRTGRFLVYNFVRLYEGQRYSDFINSDLLAVLSKSRITIKAETPAVLGAVRIIKGIRTDDGV